MKRFKMDQVEVLAFVLTLLRAVNKVQSLDFCFDASLEGFRLDSSSILKKISVPSKMECIVLCVKEQCCRSVNYMERLPQSHHSLCEMLHDAVYASSKLEKNRFYDYVYFTEPLKEYNSSCIIDIDTTVDFDLNFTRKAIDSYVLLDTNVPEMYEVSIVFWINTLETLEMAVLSYAVEGSAGELRLLVKRDKLIIQLRSLDTFEFPVPPINDGFWHLVGLTWLTRSLGQYSIYLDGTLIYSGVAPGWNTPLPLKANGVFAIGQKLLSTDGTFDLDHSFTGKLSQVNVWNYHVDVATMASVSQSCSNHVGNIINWSILRGRASKAVVKEQRSSCRPLRNNSEYDVILTAEESDASHNLHTILKYVPDLQAFTITFWEFVSIASIKYNVEQTGTDDPKWPKNALKLFFGHHKCVLAINDITRQAKIPRYRSENPAYWHHVATTWSSSSGHWKVYLDGSLVSIVHDIASGTTIPAGGPLYLTLKKSGKTNRLNMWDYEVDGHAISLMANKGPMFENGNVFAWYGVKSKIVGDMNFESTPSDLYNSRLKSVYQMNFPEASVKNYARMDKPFSSDIEKFSVCFWAKILRTNCAIFAYSTTQNDAEFQAFLSENGILNLNIRNNYLYAGPFIDSYDSWHFYCMQWRNFDGFTEYYQDAKKLKEENKTSSIGVRLSSNGVLILGQEMDGHVTGFSAEQAFKGSLAGLNFWKHFLDLNTIQGMSAGVINVNGNLLQWRDPRWIPFGNVPRLNRSEAEIPEYRVQALRDEWCRNAFAPDIQYARFIRNQNSGYEWRCVGPSAMLPENMCYDLSKNSSSYYTRNAELLEIN